METHFSLGAGLGPADTVGSPSVEGTLPATDLSLPRIVAVVDGGKRSVGVDTFTPVLGVDYIVDCYAVLGVSRTATDAEIKAAYREKSRGCHPDVVPRASAEIRALAESQFRVLGTAFAVLSDANRRAELDAKLDVFPPELISKSGVPIINLSGRRVCVDLLLGGYELREPDRDAMIRANDSYSPDLFKMVEQRYQELGANVDPATARLYRDQLRAKLFHLKMAEDSAWRAAGIVNQPEPEGGSSGESYSAGRKAQIEEVLQELPLVIEGRLLTASAEGTPLLLPPSLSETVSDTTESPEGLTKLTERLSAAALESFATRKEELVRLGKQVGEVIDALIELTEWRYVEVQGAAVRGEELVIYISSESKVVAAMRLQIVDQCATPVPFESNLRGVPDTAVDSTHPELLKIGQDGASVALLIVDREIPLREQLTFVISQHSARFRG
jgi:hypothetical protein